MLGPKKGAFPVHESGSSLFFAPSLRGSVSGSFVRMSRAFRIHARVNDVEQPAVSSSHSRITINPAIRFQGFSVTGKEFAFFCHLRAREWV